MTTGVRGSDGRLRELILHAATARQPKWVTREWLLNVLFLIDIEAYRKLGRSISGKTYRKMPDGPTPSRFDRVVAKMVRDGDLRLAATPPRDSRGRFRASAS